MIIAIPPDPSQLLTKSQELIIVVHPSLQWERTCHSHSIFLFLGLANPSSDWYIIPSEMLLVPVGKLWLKVASPDFNFEYRGIIA